jgi:hypothetical protein
MGPFSIVKAEELVSDTVLSLLFKKMNFEKSDEIVSGVVFFPTLVCVCPASLVVYTYKIVRSLKRITKVSFIDSSAFSLFDRECVPNVHALFYIIAARRF